MPVNRNALIRYKTIDKCLQNRYRRWTLEDLIEACSEALYEYEGIDKGVSKRTVQSDIQVMRSDKLGYNAPIIVSEKKYYTYEDSEYSITNIPLSEQDLNMLTEAVEFMKQFQGFSHFRELDGMVQKLEDHIYSQKTHTKSVIDFEKNEGLKGLEYLDPLYQAIIRSQTLQLTYKPFGLREANQFIFYPYLLKEYRNRWFILGIKNRGGRIFILALDRIQNLELSKKLFIENTSFDTETYFDNIIGVTVDGSRKVEEVIFHANYNQAPYIITKPFHPSQKVIAKDKFGITFSIKVQFNFEMEREFLGFGDGVKILSPENLKRKIRSRLLNAVDTYDAIITEKKLKILSNKLSRKGSDTFERIYTHREVNKIGALLDRELIKGKNNIHAQRKLIQKAPSLKPLIFNQNFVQIIQSISPNAFLTKAIYFDKPQEANWYVSWHQDVAINVKDKIELEGFSKWTFKQEIHSVCPPEELRKENFTIRIHLDEAGEDNGALRIIQGSHLKIHSDQEIRDITTNAVAHIVKVPAGGIHIMHPLLLHASPRTKNQKRRRVIHLEFSAEELPGELEWLEREPIL